MRYGIILTIVSTALAFGQKPPETKVQPVTETMHGVTITDPYRWLEDQNSPQTRAWIDAQVRYTDAVLAKMPDRERIRMQLRDLLKVETMSTPIEYGGRYFFSKRGVDQEQEVLCVRRGPAGSDSVLVDPNSLSPDHTVSAHFMGISEDGKLVAYGLRRGGEDEMTLSFLDVDTHKELADQFPRARYAGVSIVPDRSGFYYSKFLPVGVRVFYHSFGADPKNDREVFGQGHGPTEIVYASLSPDGHYLVLVVAVGAAANRTQVYVQDLAAHGSIRPIVDDVDARFDPSIAGDRLYFLTNWKAPNGRILAVDLKKPARANWQEVVAESTSVISDFSPLGGKLVVNRLENVSTRIEVLNPDGKPVREVPLPGIGTAIGPSGRWASNEAFYMFSSFGQPPTIYRYQVSSGAQQVWWRSKAPIDPASIDVKQVWYESKDHTRVPMFIARRKDLKPDGHNPALLTGYGGFDVSSLPGYSPFAAAWLEMGGVYAKANLRGGGEFGEAWHRAGMLGNKQNVFDDFIAAAEYLVAKGYTGKSRLAIAGGSNGGLLVGAAMTQRPELFQAVLCMAPLLDMLRYQKFKIARLWIPEYGSADDAKQFAYIYRYSPYQHVTKGVKYPAVMFVTGDADTRVDPLHARKMAALMQASTASDRPIVLHYDTKAGHSGGLPVDRQIGEMTDELSFLAGEVGIYSEAGTPAPE